MSGLLTTISEAPNHSGRRIFHALLPYLWPPGWRSRGIIFFAFLTLIIAKAMGLVAPFFYKNSVDAFGTSIAGAATLPMGFILAYGGARIAGQLTNHCRNLAFDPFLTGGADDVRLRFFAHLHALSLRFHLDRQTGALTMALERGVSGMRYVIENLFFNIIPTVIELMLISLMLTKLYNISYAGIILVTVLIYGGCTHWLTERRGALLRAYLDAYDRTNTVTMDSILNYETVKYYVKEHYESRRLKDSRSSLRGAMLKHMRAWQGLSLFQGSIITCGLCAAMFLAAHQVLADQMTIGDYVLVNTYLLQLFVPLGALGSVYIESKRAFVDMEAMLSLLATQPEVVDRQDALPLRIIGGEISFEDVYFAYEPARKALKGISFLVPAGKRVAIVGATGAGKSTIAKLLFRSYNLTGGRILIDGQDISLVTQDSLHAAVGVVPQDTILFNDTIYYNIAYGALSDDAEPSREAVEQAAKLARLHDFIVSLPLGYETRVGERGLKLSGGEKQRVAIARTILKSPLIFLFDEATSALDNKTEAEIQTRLRSVAANRTTLVIAHRLSTIADADAIIVLDRGEIVERGDHESLLALDGHYARMWHRQED